MADVESAISITVARSGGIAGIRRQWRTEGTLDSWRQSIDACPWQEADGSGPAHPDGFVWRIEVDGEKRCSAVLAESGLTGAWNELVERVKSESVTPNAER